MTTARPPRSRIEHRHADLSPLVVAFADTPNGAHQAVGIHRPSVRRRGGDGELVIVD